MKNQQGNLMTIPVDDRLMTIMSATETACNLSELLPHTDLVMEISYLLSGCLDLYESILLLREDDTETFKIFVERVLQINKQCIRLKETKGKICP